MVDAFTTDPRSLKMKDFVISDEYEIIDAEEGIKAAIEKLLSMTCGVLLVKEGKDIDGVITERRILKKISDTKDPMGLKVKDIMDTKMLRLDYNQKLTEAMESIAKEKPAAVIIVSKDGEFRGYFSPMDYLQAEKLLKDAKKRGKLQDTGGEDELGEK